MLEKQQKTAIIVGLKLKAKNFHKEHHVIEDSLNELSNLLRTLNVTVFSKEIQIRETPSPATYIGEGRANEIRQLCQEHKISMVVFDDELSPAQARNLWQIIGVSIYDRTEVILDIFSEHARTKEAKIQVEIAKKEFMLSRVQGLWTHFDRQRGGVGIGARDAGEKQIELDRRILRDRISRLKKELRHLESVREVQRKLRKNVLQVALVGYTNAGKTTLMNALTDSNLLAEDKLFATLDSTVKILNPANRPRILISDTVGFIDKLPHKLISSFKSTLDELFSADLILHVVDISAANYDKHIQVTHQVLEELKVFDKPSFIVFNKGDKIEGDFLLPKLAKRKYLESILVSAYNKENILQLRQKVIDFFEKQMLNLELVIPYSDQDKLSDIFKVSHVLEKKYREENLYLKLKVAKMHYDRLALKNFVIE